MKDDTLPTDPLRELRDALRAFAAERDWDQFHSPKNLSMALSVDAAELLEHFQWLKEEDSRQLPPQALAEIGEEMADVLLYLVRLADKLDIDIVRAAKDKMRLNAEKYPADKSRGNSRKSRDL